VAQFADPSALIEVNGCFQQQHGAAPDQSQTFVVYESSR
jgi:hypothetical protein